MYSLFYVFYENIICWCFSAKIGCFCLSKIGSTDLSASLSLSLVPD